MSKQPAYQQLKSDVSSAEEYGFAARLPQAGRSCGGKGPCRGKRTCRAPCQASGTRCGHVAYPASVAYAGRDPGDPVTGYPVMATPIAGPVGMVAVNPLETREMNQACRPAKAAGGCRRCHGCRKRRRGPVGLLVGLVRSALR